VNYRFRVEARDDLRNAAAFYDLQRLGLGDEFAVEVGIAIARIVDAPRRWPEVEPGVRRYRLDRFPYGIFYQLVAGQLVEVVAVFDLRRRPNGWRDRLP
jgi:plasmid stabilization system protein ParE